MDGKENRIRVLYVDDEPHNLTSFKATFRTRYDVTTAISAADAIVLLGQKEFHVIITDQRMPNMTGVEFLESILDRYPDPVRLLLTGYADLNAVIEAVNKGKIFHYLSKPWNEEELDATILRGFAVYSEKAAEKDITKKLEVSNDQLEFLLRQKLLS